MKNIVLLVFFGCIALCVTAQNRQDSTFTDYKAEGVRDASDFGLLFGLNYSNFSLKSNPFLVDTLTQKGSSRMINSPGLSVGVFYNIKLGQKLLLRPSVEANIIPSTIEYDIVVKKYESWIYPLTVDVPVTLIYGNNDRDYLSESKRDIHWFLGVRPVFPLQVMASSEPVLKNFNFNTDIGVSFPFVLPKTIMRAEFFYSHGWLNIIGENEEDAQTSSIDSMKRSLFGCRFYFN